MIDLPEALDVSFRTFQIAVMPWQHRAVLGRLPARADADHSRAAFLLLSALRQFTDGFFRILADDRDRLRRGDVVPGTPISLTRDGIEVLLNDLLSP